MSRYSSLIKPNSIEARYSIFVNSHEFLTFAKNTDKNVSKNLGGKYTQKPLNHAKQSGTGVKTTSKRVIQNTVEATDYLISNTTPVTITSTPRT